MLDIPAEVSKEHMAICEKCEMRKLLARAVDIHIDWIDCFYVCDNDYETWKEKENG